MGKKLPFAVLAVIASMALTALPATSQSQAPSKAQPQSQFDLAGSFYRTMSSSTTGHGVVQKATDANGFLFEARYLKSTWIGGEISYGWNPANQSYAPTATGCGYSCTTTPEAVKASANEVGFNWIPSKAMGNLRPFGVAGIGFVMTVAPGHEYAVNTSVKPVYILGGGVDWGLSERIGIRAQFRDNLFSAPQETFAFPATGKFTNVAEPTVGIYFRL